MLVNRTMIEGITKVKFPNQTEQVELENENSQKEFYITFSWPKNDANLLYINSLFPGSLSLSAKFHDEYTEINNEVFFTIRGVRKTIFAIEKFLTGNRYQFGKNSSIGNSNQQLFTDLTTYRDRLIRVRSLKSAPAMSVNLSDLEIIQEVKPSIGDATHPVYKVRNIKDGKTYYLKFNIQDSSIIEIEAFETLASAAVLGEQVPEVKIVFKENKERVGLISEEIKGKTFLAFYKENNKQPISSEKFITTPEPCEFLRMPLLI